MMTFLDGLIKFSLSKKDFNKKAAVYLSSSWAKDFAKTMKEGGYKVKPAYTHQDKFKGGLADKKSPLDYDLDQLKKGIKVEYEHTNDKQTAQEIAMDHLEESPSYYDYLEEMERKMEKKSTIFDVEDLLKKKEIKEVKNKIEHSRHGRLYNLVREKIRGQ